MYARGGFNILTTYRSLCLFKNIDEKIIRKAFRQVGPTSQQNIGEAPEDLCRRMGNRD
jgi:hypothetical protein